MRRWIGVVVLLVSAPAVGGSPGQPMDCSDWTGFVPGFTCTVAFECPSSVTDRIPCQRGNDAAVDNEGHPLFVRRTNQGACNERWVYVYRRLGSGLELIGEFFEKCNDPIVDRLYLGTGDATSTEGQQDAGIVFDEERGRLLIPFRSSCRYSNGAKPPECTYEDVYWIAAIEGFATEFEILQTYTPDTAELSFRVPYMPEGFERADWFDTYWGDLATVGDWSQLQPLACAYPAMAPQVGDYLSVADTVPTPAPGGGVYYLTAATLAGEMRFGREATGGSLKGRNPSTLPSCD